VSKEKKRPGSAAARGQSRRTRNKRPPLIPIVVGAVLFAILAGVIVSLERVRSAGSEAVTAAATAQALPTQSIPYPQVSRIPLAEAKARLDRGQAILVDVRGKASYDEAHAAGAISVPEEEVQSRLQELHDKELILYCT